MFLVLVLNEVLFNTNVLINQGEIKITAFNNEVDKFFSLVEQAKVSKFYYRTHPHFK